MAIIGIDLGTTNSLVSVYRDNKVELIPNRFGEILTPSVVSIEDGNITVGKIAKEKLITNSEHTIAAFKVFMGMDKTFTIDRKKYTPVDLSSMIIKQLVQDAKEYLQEEIEEAIISVPAYFNDAKRLATKQAGQLAGIKVERIINEPSAAALASRIDSTEFETLLIFDFGGGTLDVSIVDCFDDVVEIVAVSGDNHLGGEDFNHLIEGYMCNAYHLKNLPLKDKAILLRNIEEIKKELAIHEEAKRDIVIQGKEITISLSREQLLMISSSLLYKIKTVVKKALQDAQMNVTDIDRLIMVGGSSRLIAVQEYLEYLFHINPEVSDQIDYLVGLGCGYVAGIKSRNETIKDKVLTDICPFSLGVSVYNPDGRDDLFSTIIERNSTLPCSKKEYYYAIRENQTKIDFKIYQGEDMIAKNNHFIGDMTVDVAGSHDCTEVIFTYDINGILDIDVTSSRGNYHKVITNQECVLTPDEVKKRIAELDQLKQQTKEDDTFDYLYEKATRIYEESIGEKRIQVSNIIKELNALKHKGKIVRIEKAKKEIEQKLQDLENQSPFVFENEDKGMLN